MMTRSVPDFIVAGAQKAGTTTLHDWLVQSSEVALPWSKETHFFRDEEKFSNGMNWYLKQFKTITNQTKLIGEIDPEYMYFPECAERIKRYQSSPKLIFVLRDPISRARSHYQMSLRRGYETLPFSEALALEKDRLKSGGRFSRIHHSYIDRGLYSGQIERMRKAFPESEILVLLFDDLFNSQVSAMESLRRICDFLGISYENMRIDVSARENQAAVPRFILLRNFIYKKGPVKSFFGKLIPSSEIKLRLMRFLDRINARPLQRNDVSRSAEVLQKIHPDVYEEFLQDMARLEKLVDVDISDWRKKYEIFACT